MKQQLTLVLTDLDILAGNRIGPSDASWQDVAGTCAINMMRLAGMLNEARIGNAEPFLVFPDPRECIEEACT